MRILFTFIGGNGHFVPLIPVANAARAAGHTVAVACSPSMISVVEAAGFTALPLGTASPSASTPPERLPLRPIDMAREDEEFRDRFARDGTRNRLPLTLAVCTAWQPDLLVCDETNFGAMLAAERLGLPYASVLVIAAGSFVRKEQISSVLNEIRAEHNLPPDPELAMLDRYLTLSPFPPSFRHPAYPLPPTAHAFRPALPEAAHRPAPTQWLNLPGAPLVYFTLGTVFNTESGDLFARVLSGLRTLPINLLVTTGSAINPSEFGPQPANVTIERYIPQDEILPHCSLVVSHGGSGSVAGTLLYGLPSVLIPMGADQPLNALRCVELGISQMLDPLACTPEDVRVAASTVLSTPTYRLAAERMRDEFTALPGPERVVRLLEELVN